MRDLATIQRTISYENREGIVRDLLTIPEGAHDARVLALELSRVVQNAYDQGRADERAHLRNRVFGVFGERTDEENQS